MDREIRQTAQHSEATVDELQELVPEANEYLSRNIDQWVDTAFWSGDPSTFLGRVSGTYVFGLDPRHWDSLRIAIETDDAGLEALQVYHRRRAQNLATGDGPDLEEELDDELIPTVVPYPDNWRLARTVMSWEIVHLIELGVSPSRALDYWMIEVMEWDPSEWADSRGVGIEAVRKGRREAIAAIEEAQAA